MEGHVRNSKFLGFPTWTHSVTPFAPGLVEWSIASTANKLREEERREQLAAILGQIADDERHDETYLEVATAAFGAEKGGKLLYDRLKQRGFRRLEQQGNQ